MDKRCSSQRAIATINSGMTIGIGGWGPRRKPMALIRELLRADVNNLTIVSYGGMDVGMLCAAGKVRRLVFAFVSMDFIPLEPYFRQARQHGEIEVMELDEGLMMMGLRAAAMGSPYIPTAVGLGTDVAVKNKEIKIVESPYADDKEWLAMPALNLDVALVHVNCADQRGVCEIQGPDHYMDDLYMRAAQHTIVSCDELVASDYFCQNPHRPRSVFWERGQTNMIVHAPCGAHPGSCNPLYGLDVNHLRQYAASAKEEGGWEAYFNRYVAVGDAEYLREVGGVDAIRALPLPMY